MYHTASMRDITLVSLVLKHYWGHFYSMPFHAPRGAYSKLLPHDCLNKFGDHLSHTNSVLSKLSIVSQVVVAAIVISRNKHCVWTMYLCMDSVTFILDTPSAKTHWGASILWGHYYNLQTLLGGGGGGGGGGGASIS